MILSILTVTLNAGVELPGLAQSIRSQGRFDEVEWIVVDGASKDDTLDVIKANDDAISRWISEPDCGFYHALNKAIAMARGDYYLVMGADDRFHPGAFAAILEVVKQRSAEEMYCFSVLRGGRIRRSRQLTALRRALGWSSFISSHSVGTVLRRSLHESLGPYSLRYPLLADGHFMMKAIARRGRIEVCEACLGEFANGGLTSSDEARLAAETWLIQLHLGQSALVQTLLFLARAVRMGLRRVRR